MLVTAILFALNICHPAVATPLQLLDARDSDQGLSLKAWIPIVVVVIMLCLVALMMWSRHSLHHAVTTLGGIYNPSQAPARSGRELTAEQLAGSINGSELPTSGATARQTRRPRRPRRTPSQVSVTSLPAYNKEPGEEELVIFRGRDMEDATMPPATVAEEDDSSLNSHSHDNSQVSRYSPMPLTSNEMPLLHRNGPSADISLQSVQSSEARRPSLDSSQETSSLMRIDTNLPRTTSDPRGEAPAYFEVVDDTPEPNSEVPTTQTSPTPPSTEQRRRSGFRTFLNRMSMMTHVPEHRRTESNQSASSSTAHRRDQSAPSRTSNHRVTSSHSGSVVNLSMFRQRSSQTLNSSVRLNSPSLISLNSISSPLSHTLVRTEFTYPKSGPTPEQLKVISSRENFSRFGVPYGPDAIAFAASSSRQDIEPPPPDFEVSTSPLSPVDSRLSRTDLSGSVEHTQDQPPSIPARAFSEEEEGADHSDEAGPDHSDEGGPSLSADTQSENVPVIPVPSITHNDPQTSDLISPTVSSSASPQLSPTSEFGKFSLTLRDAAGGSTTRSQSRVSNYSLQSYATAAETLGREKTGHTDAGSEPPTPTMTREVMGIKEGIAT